jgi:hypothetical protein
MASELQTELPFIVELTWQAPDGWTRYAQFAYAEAAEEYIKRRIAERPKGGPDWRASCHGVVFCRAIDGVFRRD